jgi:outer membrane protein OmpA-like peptidoglycan-associated protein
MNLFDTLNEAMTDEVVSKIAKLTDEEPTKTKKAIDGIFCTLIAGLVRRTGSTMSVNMLYNQVQKGNQGGELIGDIMSYLTKKDKLDAILKTGDGLVSQVFPAYKSPLISMIGTYAGIKKNSSTMYSSLATPILIDAVGREISNNKMDVDALTTYLAEHHEPLFKRTPEELVEKMIPQLGLQELLSPKFTSNSGNKRVVAPKPASVRPKTVSGTPTSTPQVVETEEEEYSSEGSAFPVKWLLIFLVVIAAAAGGYYYYENYYKPSQAGVSQEETTVIDSTTASPDNSARAAIDSVALKDSTNAATPVATTAPTGGGSLTQEVEPYLTDKAKPVGQIFTMKDVSFVKGSQALDDKSAASINELAELMKKYPKMQIRIQGHSTDAVGIDNKAMATKRAFAIKKRLLVAGITDTRIDAIGIQGSGDKADIKVVTK